MAAGRNREKDTPQNYRMVFFFTVLVAFTVSLAGSVLVALPRIEASVLNLQQNASRTETDLTTAYIQQFVITRLMALRDIARYPIIKNAVMGSGISEQDLADFLSDITIMGKKEDMALLDIAAEKVYSRYAGTPRSYSSDSDWFKRIIESETNYEVNLINEGEKNYFQVAIPVKYGEFVEGVLVSEIDADLELVLEGFSSSGDRALKLSKNGVSIATKNELDPNNELLTEHPLPLLGVTMIYEIDTSLLLREKDSFLLLVAGSITLALAAAILVLLISGNITIVAPYRRLLQLTEERDSARIAAESSANAKSEFLASMSHEIRTPMNGILGMLSLLSTSELNPDQARKVNLASESARSLLVIINDILDFSKIEARKLDIEEIPFDIIELFEEFSASQSFHERISEIDFVVDASGVSHTAVIGDPSRIKQILHNFVGNAFKFTNQGEVVLSLSSKTLSDEEIMLECTVTDTGIGIPEDKLKDLFSAFTQADSSTTRKFGGTGLGLSICKQLCDLMNGDIQVWSKLDIGSSFGFNIPLKLADKKAPPELLGDFAEQRVLVYIANQRQRDLLCKAMEQAGAHIETLESLPAAQERITAQSDCCDIAILDVSIKHEESQAFLDWITANTPSSTINFLFVVTPRNESDDLEFSNNLKHAFVRFPNYSHGSHERLCKSVLQH